MKSPRILHFLNCFLLLFIWGSLNFVVKSKIVFSNVVLWVVQDRERASSYTFDCHFWTTFSLWWNHKVHSSLPFFFSFFFFLCHNYEKVKSWFYNLTIEIMNSTDVTHSTHQCFFFFWVGYSLSLVCLFLSDVHFLLFYLCPLFRILFLYLYFVCQNELGPFLKVVHRLYMPICTACVDLQEL